MTCPIAFFFYFFCLSPDEEAGELDLYFDYLVFLSVAKVYSERYVAAYWPASKWAAFFILFVVSRTLTEAPLRRG